MNCGGLKLQIQDNSTYLFEGFEGVSTDYRLLKRFVASGNKTGNIPFRISEKCSPAGEFQYLFIKSHCSLPPTKLHKHIENM